MVSKKLVREEKPTDFEKITIEFNTIYNEILALTRDKDAKAAQERYLKLYNLYLRLTNENLKKSHKEILDKRMEDVSDIVPSKRKFVKLKNKKI